MCIPCSLSLSFSLSACYLFYRELCCCGSDSWLPLLIFCTKNVNGSSRLPSVSFVLYYWTVLYSFPSYWICLKRSMQMLFLWWYHLMYCCVGSVDSSVNVIHSSSASVKYLAFMRWHILSWMSNVDVNKEAPPNVQ